MSVSGVNQKNDSPHLPNISGNSVTSDTIVTSRPAAASFLAVPPVEIILTPTSLRPVAKASKPVLSKTETRARRTCGDEGELP